MEEKRALLRRVPLFSDVKEKDLRVILKNTTERRYRKGSYMFFEKEPGNTLFIIISGLVKIYKSDASGRIKTLTYLKEGDFFGEMAMLDEEARSASAQVMQDTHVLVLERQNFHKEIMGSPAIALKVMKTLSARLRIADKQLEDLTFRNLPGRVASTLLQLAEKHGEKTREGMRINLSMTHQELAEMVGTAREAVTSILGDFRAAKAVQIHNKFITITNKEELASWIT